MYADCYASGLLGPSSNQYMCQNICKVGLSLFMILNPNVNFRLSFLDPLAFCVHHSIGKLETTHAGAY